jgi:translation initiation factor 5B
LFGRYAGVRIGPVVRKDVMRASTMLEHEEKYACILAFDVKVVLLIIIF